VIVIADTNATTVNDPELVAVPSGVVTAQCPDVPTARLRGTFAWIVDDDATVNASESVPANLTAVAPVKFVPVIVTDNEPGPVDGVNDVIVGAAI
jgi:hypothetical protein